LANPLRATFFGQGQRVGQIRLEGDDVDAAGRMRGGEQREKAPTRADVDEQIARPQHPLEEVAGRRLVAGIGLVDDQMLGADVAGKAGEEMQAEARRLVGMLERAGQHGPAIDRLQADRLVGIHRYLALRPERIGAARLYISVQRSITAATALGPQDHGMKTIAIIGSTGTNARPWTDAFLAAGWQIRSLVRDPRKVESRPRVTAMPFDFNDPQSHAPALADVDVLALISPAQPNQVAWESALIAAARRAALGGIIKLSVLGAEMTVPISFFARNAAQVDGVLRASGVRHVILRANGFLQNLLRQRAAIEAGNLVEPSGTTAASRIDVHDVAAVAVAIADGPFDGRAFSLTGPAALTGDEMAATLSGVLGRPVRYISPPLAQFRAALLERGLPAWQIDAFVELHQAVLDGRAPHLTAVTADVEAATGRPPRSFAQFAQREFGRST
jgi:uncharacterized protein YbjT (DUF2867 family)